MLNKLPLHDIHCSEGAEFMEQFNWSIPTQYSDVGSEYHALQRDSGLVDLCNSVILELQGDDRTRFLNGMVTNDIKALLPGQGCHAVFLSPQGRMIADLKILCFAERFLLIGEPAVKDTLGSTLRKYIIGDRSRLLDRSGELGLFSLQGPKSRQVISMLLGEAPALRSLYDHVEVVAHTATFEVCRIGRTPAGGFDLVIPYEHLSEIWALLLENGREYGLRPVGFSSYNIRRVESGIPLFGIDMNDQILPLEAGMEKDAISYTKGCYIGQESVARITYRGHVNRKLSGLRLDNGEGILAGDKVLKGDQEVGWISSVVHSPSLGFRIALAYLRREVEHAAEVKVAHESSFTRAEVTALPFISAENNQ